ncbi:cysteine synthase family protein [Maritimibacter sp. UBA3975]|uniref:PLP-dependent cysteine synthase family protein n=1 Tax=Maritimibacter sp. UBA3975 TaxID=1946833 RepID=UPI000C09BD1D|nr:cysteine synthase family protein [Maritimibacter sp. UBA3975]MAM60123.1 cysteine synthase [Maritimibacter sp.]|tara:strand:- start:14261 stop:15187 length:927 start_codon:yes stop_codon:yes gene_type:complete
MAYGAGLSAIGNTPLVRLEKLVPDGAAEVWVKLEGANPTGSYKDRMAISVLGAALEQGRVKAGDTVVEFTGGSTGSALAFVSAVLGLKFTAIFSDAFSYTKQQAMEAFGAEVLVEKCVDGAITHELAERMKARAHSLAAQPGYYYADQFGSPDVRAGYQPLGREIAEALDGGIDVFCASVGTGATLMGTLDGLRAAGGSPKVVALEPTESALLSTGVAGAHNVEGIAVFPAPPFLDRDVLSDIRTVDQDKAFEMCRRLARIEGIFGGGSTGLNVCAAIDLAVELGPGKRVVTISCDHGSKYLGGRIYS